MTDRRSSDVLGSLPQSRPHRRSDKRGARADQNGSTDSHSSTDRSARPEEPAPKQAAAAPAPRNQGSDRASAAKKSPARKTVPKRATTPKRVTTPKAASASKASSSAKPVSPRKPAAGSRPARPPLRQPAQPGGIPQAHRAAQPEPPERQDLLGTAVQAAAELAEIGLTLGARALRSAMSRVPRP